MSLSLKEAIVQEEKRQPFLDAFFTRPIPYCSGIFYDPKRELQHQWITPLLSGMGFNEHQCSAFLENALNKGSSYAAGFPLPSFLLGCGMNVPLFIGEDLFSNKYGEGELRNIIEAHEATHLRQVAQGIPGIDTAALRQGWVQATIRPLTAANILELDANYASLLGIQEGRHRVNDTYREKCRAHYAGGLSSLYNLRLDSRMPIEKRIITQALDFFPHKRR